ncbi:helicase-related protein [Desulforamulus ferrireducens]|uniref:Helicase C-terminal domain-containing protein n=1 Tax=Desulforamulus ferrireducens TaxID=1833852 RepID=A0A1S6IXN1_9FIRM|nr:helicase-related protein [Desulforamulus ferrireducens]AQS59525.1 hypothetical protein B0537_10800 [Desulforamulus ferrireducens]
MPHIKNREKIIQALFEELVGPSPQGEELDCSGTIIFETPADSYRPYRQKESGEEILQRDRPTVRYGVGVLYPIGTEHEIVAQDITGETGEENDWNKDYNELVEQRIKNIEEIQKRAEIGHEPESDDFELSNANTFSPSTMGISFLAEFPEESKLIVEASGGRYEEKKITVAGNERKWWLRKPVTIYALFNGNDICCQDSKKVKESFTEKNTGELNLQIEVFSRPVNNLRTRLVTVCLVNRSEYDVSKEHLIDQYCLFQTFFKVMVISDAGDCHILPYPRTTFCNKDKDLEEQSLDLLYREAETYAVGHGCAADWKAVISQRKAMWVSAQCLPIYETPSITPDIKTKDGRAIEVPMAPLAGLVPGNDGISSLKQIIQLYQEWIEEKKEQIGLLDKEFQYAANHHMENCQRCANKMKEGLEYLLHNKKALRAFQLANYAILLQQSIRKGPREVQFEAKENRYKFLEQYQPPDPLNPGPYRGKWRAFQIAFLLMSIKSTVEGKIPDRNTVELIWFPTGGGKTEAYLGLAAFSMFMRRIANPTDSGVSVIMRYTLRLLTAQQFQRTSGLLCAMEYIRRKYPSELGEAEFSIGMWLGGDTTPNTRKDAITALRKLNKGAKVENPFVLGSCPWCGAKMGRYGGTLPEKSPLSRVLGYEQKDNSVVFKCPDSACEFNKGLPIYVIDEDIYQKRPSLVIGTVDKFAMLAWRPEARSIFGIDKDGNRESSPPGLIIQDELHLISGPLGSMVGLYESVIEKLCTDYRKDVPIVPKIVCSTATIRRYSEQVKALYGRDNVALFPPPGLDAGDSFFSQYACHPDGKLQPGRIYVGVHAPGLRSMQTAQVRTFSALLQAPVDLNNEERDPWWTLLIFFNSLRELGTTLSLFQSDIPDYLRVISNRIGKNLNEMRSLWNIMELTSRLRGDQVPKAIEAMEVPCTKSKYPVDVCLASNIIEVGVDIDRLSVMAVVGQPKTTSQYIQVTGRVGRRWWERPGIVVTIYGAAKPRDRSHFEKFRSYHERLYAQVEPTSATPFSPPALDRALHAVMVAYTRQVGNENIAGSPYPFPDDLVNEVGQILMERVEKVDKNEITNTDKVIRKRVKEWKFWQRIIWENWDIKGDIPLLRLAGSYASKDWEKLSWSTPMSMRNVDAECKVQITRHYLYEGEDDDE